MTKKEKTYLLSEGDVSYFRHFVRQFQNNYRCGRIEEAHHDAIACILHLQILFGDEEEEEEDDDDEV